MLFHITQVHTPETCPRDEGGSNTLFDPNVFFATEREQAEYAFHLSARSWKDEVGLRTDLARAERDRAIAREELRKLQKRYDSLERGNRLRRILRRPPLQ